LIAVEEFASEFGGAWLVVAEVLAVAGAKLATKLGDSSFAKGVGWSVLSPAIVPVTPPTGVDVFALPEFAPFEFAGSLERMQSECQGQNCRQISSGHVCGSGGFLSSVFASAFAVESVAGVAGSASDPHKRQPSDNPEHVENIQNVTRQGNTARSGRQPRR
jgi:hypothetical protein